MTQDNLITVTVRSHVPPSASIKDFAFGKPFQFRLKNNTILEVLLKQLFFENIKNLGFTAVNGELSTKDRCLSEGDVVYIYNLLLGG